MTLKQNTERHPHDFPGSQAAYSVTRLVTRSGHDIGQDYEQLVDLVDMATTTDTGEKVAILLDDKGRAFAKRLTGVRAIGPVAKAMLRGAR